MQGQETQVPETPHDGSESDIGSEITNRMTAVKMEPDAESSAERELSDTE